MKNSSLKIAVLTSIILAVTGCKSTSNLGGNSSIDKPVNKIIDPKDNKTTNGPKRTPDAESEADKIKKEELALAKKYQAMPHKSYIVYGGRNNGEDYKFLLDPKLGKTIKGKSELEANYIQFDNEGEKENLKDVTVDNRNLFKDKITKLVEHTYGDSGGWDRLNSYLYSEILLLGDSGYSYADGNFTAYFGKPTNSSELKKLTEIDNGYATYQGKAYGFAIRTKPMEYNERPKFGRSEFEVDFQKKTIKGYLEDTISYTSDYGDTFSLSLVNGKIKEDNGNLTFKGDIEFEGSMARVYDDEPKRIQKEGSFEGRFMGPRAAELAGSAEVDNSRYITDSNKIKSLKFIFNARKDLKPRMDAYK